MAKQTQRATFFVQLETGVVGPITSRELRTWAAAGKIVPGTNVALSKPGEQGLQWVSAKHVKGLFDGDGRPLANPDKPVVPQVGPQSQLTSVPPVATASGTRIPVELTATPIVITTNESRRGAKKRPSKTGPVGERAQPVTASGQQVPPLPGAQEEWHYICAGNPQGPVTLTELVELARQQGVNRESLVWHESLDDWMPVAEVPQLVSLFPGATKQLPPPLNTGAFRQVLPSAPPTRAMAPRPISMTVFAVINFVIAAWFILLAIAAPLLGLIHLCAAASAIVSGIGLLQMSAWSRAATKVWALVMFLTPVFIAFVGVAAGFTTPVVVGWLLWSIYPGVLLLFLRSLKWKAAFAASNPGDGTESVRVGATGSRMRSTRSYSSKRLWVATVATAGSVTLVATVAYWFTTDRSGVDGLIALGEQIERNEEAEVVGIVFAGPKITNEVLVHLPRLTSLQKLNFKGTKITDAGLVHLQGLTNLRQLGLGSHSITSKGLTHLRGLRKLEDLNLYNTRIDDTGLAHLRGLTTLQVLTLGDTRITDAGLVHLAGLTRLRSLLLNNTAVTDAGLVNLSGLANLEELYLAACSIDGPGLGNLSGLTKLKLLTLQSSGVSDGDLKQLTTLTELDFLDLRQSEVTKLGVTGLEQKLPNCAIHVTESDTTDRRSSPIANRAVKIDRDDMVTPINEFAGYPINDYRTLPNCVEVFSNCVKVPFEDKTSIRYKSDVSKVAQKLCRVVLEVVDISAEYDFAYFKMLNDDGTSALSRLQRGGNLGGYAKDLRDEFSIQDIKAAGLATSRLSVGDQVVLVGFGYVVPSSPWGASSSYELPRGDKRYVMLRAFGMPSRNKLLRNHYQLAFMVRNWYIASQ